MAFVIYLAYQILNLVIIKFISNARLNFEDLEFWFHFVFYLILYLVINWHIVKVFMKVFRFISLLLLLLALLNHFFHKVDLFFTHNFFNENLSKIDFLIYFVSLFFFLIYITVLKTDLFLLNIIRIHYLFIFINIRIIHQFRLPEFEMACLSFLTLKRLHFFVNGQIQFLILFNKTHIKTILFFTEWFYIRWLHSFNLILPWLIISCEEKVKF